MGAKGDFLAAPTPSLECQGTNSKWVTPHAATATHSQDSVRLVGALLHPFPSPFREGTLCHPLASCVCVGNRVRHQVSMCPLLRLVCADTGNSLVCPKALLPDPWTEA